MSGRAGYHHFGSARAVLEATTAEILTVPGIGPERARALQETLHAKVAVPLFC